METLINLAEETRQWLGRYLAGEIPLRTFEDWLVPMTWQLGAGMDPAVTDLISEIELALAEHSNGQWTEAELREHFRALLERAARITRTAPVVQIATAFPITPFGVLHLNAVVIDNEAALVGKEEEPSLTLVGGTTAITPVL
jgi:hypothetical protein